MIVLIDNYDSFSYNLYQLVGSIDPNVKVIRSDAMSVVEIESMRPSALIISSGPGQPENAGISVEAAGRLGGRVPLLGISLGHRSVCVAYGGAVSRSERPVHGKQIEVLIDTRCLLFNGLPGRILAAGYHTFEVSKKEIPECFEVTAVTPGGEVMAVKHRKYDVFGLQFHPESVMTPEGPAIMRNFLNLVKRGSEKNDQRSDSKNRR